MDEGLPCIVRVVGSSGSGKTTAIQRALQVLAGEGLRVLVLKSTHHYPDVPGKDSWRFIEAGATGSVLVKRDDGFLAFYARLGSEWLRFVEAFVGLLGVDAVIVEGFRGLDVPGPLFDVEELGVEVTVREIVGSILNCVRGEVH